MLKAFPLKDGRMVLRRRCALVRLLMGLDFHLLRTVLLLGLLGLLSVVLLHLLFLRFSGVFLGG
jgi:hypothetical protein